MARTLKWETAVWSASSSNANAFLTVPYGGSAVASSWVSAAIVESSHADKVWVERVVGQVYMKGFDAASAPAQTNVKERVSVAHVPDPTVAPVPGTHCSVPWSATQAVDNFLWERARSVENTDATVVSAVFMQTVELPFWNVIDIKVGRLLRAGTALVYTVQTDPAIIDAGASVLVWGWIRVLMSEPGG